MHHVLLCSLCRYALVCAWHLHRCGQAPPWLWYQAVCWASGSARSAGTLTPRSSLTLYTWACDMRRRGRLERHPHDWRLCIPEHWLQPRSCSPPLRCWRRSCIGQTLPSPATESPTIIPPGENLPPSCASSGLTRWVHFSFLLLSALARTGSSSTQWMYLVREHCAPARNIASLRRRYWACIGDECAWTRPSSSRALPRQLREWPRSFILK